MPTTMTLRAERRPFDTPELRRDAGGLRHYLLGRPVHSNAEVKVRLADGRWLAGRYEWSFHPDAPARLFLALAAAEPGELTLSAGAVLRWPPDA